MRIEPTVTEVVMEYACYAVIALCIFGFGVATGWLG